MKLSITIIVTILAVSIFAQEPLLKQGNLFPDMIIKNITNASVKSIDLNATKDGKFYILNFWGTWCSPCIPEMDSLAKLQKIYKDKIQVIGISDDNEVRKQNYLKKKPSTLWLATDTSWFLSSLFRFSSVGQSIIVSPERKIVALVMADSINQKMIEKLLKNETIKSSADIKQDAVNSKDDDFGVDTTIANSLSIRSYMKGKQTMGKGYLQSIYAGRRITWYNITLKTLYREAYHIVSMKQELFDSSATEKDIDNYSDKSTLICFDLLVAPNQKDSIYKIFQKVLNANFPVKVRQEKRMLDVYVLKKINDTSFNQAASTEKDTAMFSFSGRGFDATKITVEQFATDYLSNELYYPIVDETGIKGLYNIKTNVELRTKEGIINSLKAIGLTVEKTKREMPVIVYYK